MFFPLCSFSAESKAPPEPNAEVEEVKESFNLTEYEPMYFLYNADTSKIQASFKYKIAKDINFFLGYTHNIFWQLREESMPFKDVNYNPEFFYRFDKVKYVDTVDLVAVGHKSNGKEGEDSRSYNYVGVNISPKFKLKRNALITTRFKFRYVAASDENSDINQHLGPLEFQGVLTNFSRGFIDKGQITLRIYSGGGGGEDLGQGGQELGFAFRIKGLEITPSFYVQYFQGYAENLLEYDKFQRVFRVGFLL